MDVGLYTMFGKRTPQGQAKFRGDTVTHSLGFDPATTRSSVAGINHCVRARDMWKTEVSRAIQ